MKFEPPLDSVIVECELVEFSPDGTVKLPNPEARWYGRIIAVGPGMLRTLPLTHSTKAIDPAKEDRFPMQYAVGDFVICPPGMTPFPEEVPIPRNSGTRLFVCSERQLICKVIFEPGDEQPAVNGKACKCKP